MPPKPLPKTAKARNRTARACMPSITERIERWPEIRTLEAGWIKRGAKSGLEDAVGKWRKEYSVLTKGREELPPHRFSIHTHPRAEKLGDALPSINDLIHHVINFPTHEYRNSSVIASISRKGKVMGYTFVKARKFAPEVKTDKFTPLFGLEHSLYDYIPPNTGAEETLRAFKEVFEAFGMELKIRFFPLPGYRYDGKRGMFTPKSR